MPECRTCKKFSDSFMTILMENGVHHGKLLCQYCEGFNGWAAKPDSLKQKREPAHRELAEKYGRGYCELCLIEKDLLPKGETLEGHHVVPYASGGDSTRENIWVVCTSCHDLIDWKRKYTRHWIDKTCEKI